MDTIPDWLTKEYIEAALQHNDTKNIIEVSDIEVDMPIPKGSNYVCDIYRVKATYLSNGKELATSLILKAPQEGEALAKELAESGAGEKEGLIYNELIPKLNAIFRQHNEEPITPHSYFSTEEKVVILQDMNFLGYKMVDRVKQLDLAHAELTLKALAKFHAASYVIQEREPQIIEKFGKDEFYRDAKPDSAIEKLVVRTTKILAEELKYVPDLERFAKRLNEFSDKAWDVLLKTKNPTPNEFSVISHGDCWTNNMLFKHNAQNKPEAVTLLDLQMLNYSSPAIDLLYFINLSVRHDLVETKLEELKKIYLDELNKKLKKYGSTRFLSEEELNKQIRDRQLYLVYVNVTILPWIVADPIAGKTVKLDDCLLDVKNNPVGAHFRSEPYKSIIRKRLVELERLGCI